MKLGDYAKGLQHIGLPTNDLKETVKFYEALGFETVYETVNQQASEKVAFLRLQGLTLEAYENHRASLRSGAIDHIAIDVGDAEAAYRLAQEQGLEIVSNGVEFLPFWKNGVKFFIILGPNRERIEFNQYL